VRRGPYRYFPHPNYLLVVAELIVVPLVLDLPIVALVFSALNWLVLAIRISAEDKALERFRSN
jgi:methyltransferase